MRERLQSERGITMVELLIVMFMLALLLGSTTSMFVSGSRAQAFMTKQLQAQESLHTAIDTMRKDVINACAQTAQSATSITLSEPVPTTSSTLTPCSSPTSTTWCTSGSGTSYSLYRYTSGTACTAGRLWATNLTGGSIFTYYAQNANAGSYSLPIVHINATLNVAPTTSNTGYHEVDDLVFRNSARQ